MGYAIPPDQEPVPRDPRRPGMTEREAATVLYPRSGNVTAAPIRPPLYDHEEERNQ